jgi:formylglycine-generating enzyme required for sulfatase activity
VTLTHAFEIQSTDTTQVQFFKAMGFNPSLDKACGPNCPVDNVTWNQAIAYCNSLSKGKGYKQCYRCTGSGKAVVCSLDVAYSGSKYYGCPGYRLPTEAEWEYAYRAGTKTFFYSGSITPSLCSDCSKVDPNANKIGWYCANSYLISRQVGKKMPNGWGLFDMGGNVDNWCHDWAGTLNQWPETDPVGPSFGVAKVVRGGNRNSYPRSLGASDRSGFKPIIGGIVGVRCVRSITP